MTTFMQGYPKTTNADRATMGVSPNGERGPWGEQATIAA